jgi:integrase
VVITSSQSTLAAARSRRRRGPNGAFPVPVETEALVGEWLRWLQDQGRRERTILNYGSLLGLFLDELVGARPLSAVTLEEVEAWLVRPRGGRAKGQTAAPATRARNVAIIRGFYAYLTERRILGYNPVSLLRAPTVNNRKPRAISDRTWLHAWQAACDDPGPEAVTVLGFGALFGFRRVEIVSIDCGRNLAHAPGFVSNFARKGGGDDTFPWRRVLDVWEQQLPMVLGATGAVRLTEVIAGCSTRRGELLPGWSVDTVNQRLDQWLTKWGVSAADRFTPHALRHTFVTNMLRAAVPIELVSELANHSNISITMRYVKGGSDRIGEWLRAQQVVPTTDHQVGVAGRFGL